MPRTRRQWAAKQAQSTLLLPIPTSSSNYGVGIKGSGRRGSGTQWRSTRVHALKNESPVSSHWVGALVGSQFACRFYQRVVVMAWIFSASNSELTTIRARSWHPVPWASSKSIFWSTWKEKARAAAASCTAIMLPSQRPSLPCPLCLQADFYRAYLGRRIPRQVIYRGHVTEFTPQKIPTV